MADRDLIDLIQHGSEERNLEYKSSMSWNDNATKVKVLIACLAFANIPDGGALIFGVDELDNGEFKLIGMSEEDAKTFNQDDISDYVNGYADPYIEVKVEKVYLDNKVFIIIQIQEFSEMPVVCKKHGEKGVIRGAVYTRPRRKNESVPVPSQTEMREIIELAVDKRMRRHLENIQNWGISKVTNIKSDSEKFDEQLGGL